MENESDVKKWNRVTGVSLSLAVIASIVVGFLTIPMNGVFCLLILSGSFLAIEFYLRDGSREAGGPSTADGVIMAGVLLAGIGASGLVYMYTDDVMITSICIIAFMIAAAGVMIIRNRRFL